MLEIDEMRSEKTNPVGNRDREHFEPAERLSWVTHVLGVSPASLLLVLYQLSFICITILWRLKWEKILSAVLCKKVQDTPNIPATFQL